MIEVVIDGNKIEVPIGSMIIDATKKAGCYIPHFCYHKKLSIAANCRMCLVEVNKNPKVLPACATIATNGMVINTKSELVRSAQHSVMEFLLINHPLDCPICDQGGECQLQDLAVGYGISSSRYSEEKRVVFHKKLGSLISAQEMSRCIHCTRCVRFGQEIAGVMEIGMLGRGEKSEISSFFDRSVESELSGNMIDICPVGALTSKPFRYSARTWELSRRRSISPHDSLGTNLNIQVKNNFVMRVVPLENETINECWISDRDRFSYIGLNSDDRISSPLIKNKYGKWQEISWEKAIETASKKILQIRDSFGSNQIGAIASEYATIEEYTILARLVRGLGSENIDCRLRQTDLSFDSALVGIPWLGMPITELSNLDRVLIIGSFLCNDHPLMAHRLRQATKNGAKIFLINSIKDNPRMPVSEQLVVVPSILPRVLAEVFVALARIKREKVPDEFSEISANKQSQKIAENLSDGKNIGILLGNQVTFSPQASIIAANAAAISNLLNARLGFLTFGANTIGAYLSNAIPKQGGKTVKSMFSEPLKAYIVLHAEPYFDVDDGLQALSALRSADFSIALTPYRSTAEKWANIILPISPFTETSGTFINAEGIPQSFYGVVAPFGNTRPAWKALHVLANHLKLKNFNAETSESIRDSILKNNIGKHLSNNIRSSIGLGIENKGLERITDIPIYRSDSIVRRSKPLQETKISKIPYLRMNNKTMTLLNLKIGTKVRVLNNLSYVELKVLQDDRIADHGLYISATYDETINLGSSFGTLDIEKI